MFDLYLETINLMKGHVPLTINMRRNTNHISTHILAHKLPEYIKSISLMCKSSIPIAPPCYVCYSSPSIAPCKPSPQHHDGSFLPQWVQPNEPCQQTSPRCRPSLAGSSSLNIYKVPTRKLSHLRSDQQKKNIVLWRNPKVAHLGHLLRKEVPSFFLGNIF